MATQIILPHGGYKKLLTYQKSDVIFQGTAVFVRRFLERGDRTIDQMVQAAKSGKQNIIEGSEASATSKETELKLTNVAKASLEELLEDYLDYLKIHNLPEWPKDSVKGLAARRLGREGTWEAFAPHIVKKRKALAALVGEAFTVKKGKEKLTVKLGDGDAVTVSGTVNGKKLSEVSWALWLVGKDDDGSVETYTFCVDIIDTKLNYQQTVYVMAEVGPRGTTAGAAFSAE